MFRLLHIEGILHYRISNYSLIQAENKGIEPSPQA